MNKEFAVFIMVYERPERMWTSKQLRDSGYTGKIYYVADDSDKTLDEYKAKYGDDLLVFSKKEVATEMDAGDNTNDYRSTLYASNTIFKLAEQVGVKYFMIMCDDYTRFQYTFGEIDRFIHKKIKSLDRVFAIMIDFYKKTPTTTLAMAQAGDFIGGKGSPNAFITLLRKAMNSFLCSTERPFKFIGRLNEDVTTYVRLGSIGKLFFTTTSLSLIQKESQQEKGGLTDVYLEYGTYTKSFFSVMYNPSCIKIATMGETHRRVHHKIAWKNAVPKIIREK